MLLTYTCDRCSYQRSLSYLPRVYVLESGRTVPMEQRHFWCLICGGISVAEALRRDPEVLAMQSDQIAELQELASASKETLAAMRPHQRFRAEHANETIEELRRVEADWQEWRNARSSPQKCLRCANPVEELPASDLGSFIHGGCGGLLVCTFPISSFNGPAIHAHLYDVNGSFFKRGSKPKHVPGQFHWGYEPMELFCDEHKFRRMRADA